ncbi:PQQ-binding-like beta-propeller repeat protein [Nocardiopsis sp. NPDC006139]|uniref:outer membrane protein assembly factor BamB family protein n=1 Tax=Nocardiopsis sp. NPDC006139 TaxID=3154578 RepID=UPI0033BC29A1
MRTARGFLPLLGGLAGFLPLLLQAALTWTGTPHVAAPPYVLYGPLVPTVLFAVVWFRELRPGDDKASPMRSGLLWAVLWSAVLIVAVCLSVLGGYARASLFPGDWYRITPTMVAAVVSAGFQMLLATAMVLLYRRESGVPDGKAMTLLAPVAAVAVLAGVGAVAQDTFRSLGPWPEHMVAATEPAPPEIPAEVEGIPRSLDLPLGEVRGLEAIAPGVLFTLPDGVMAVDPLTGAELWRYRSPGTDTRTLVAPDGTSLVVEEYPDSTGDTRPETMRITLDAMSGRVLHRSQDDQRLLADEIAPVESDSRSAEPWEGENVIVRTGEQIPMTVYGASSGALLWSFQGTPDCAPAEEAPVLDLEVTRELVLSALMCQGGNVPVVHAFDAATGELMWTHESENSSGRLGSSALTVSSDGSLLYRYDGHSKMYFTIDTRTGEERATGTWQNPYPREGQRKWDLWGEMVGNGVLLGSEQALTLTTADGEPAHTLELPTADGHRHLATTDQELYTVDWPDSGDRTVDLTVNPWDGTAPHTVENVLGRELSEEEGARVRVVPGAVIVYSVESGTVNAAVAVT